MIDYIFDLYNKLNRKDLANEIILSFPAKQMKKISKIFQF